MTTALWVRNILSLGMQLAVIVGVGAAIWRLLRVRQSSVSLAYWRGLLVICVLLPLGQPWRPAPLPSSGEVALSLVERSSHGEQAGAGTPPSTPRLPALTDVAIAILALGVVARSVWLLLGAWSLRRLRRDARRLEPLPSVIDQVQTRIGVRADVCVSDRIAGPITFGLRRPVVMLPPTVLSMEGAWQEAIASHELLHVQRRDWLDVILEEIIRTVFWFHPAIWWLTARIQLSREHVVDEAVIRLTNARDRYVEALLAVACTRARGAPVPAPLFLRRRLLKRRVAHILQETTMTTRRLIASVTLSAGALALASVLVVQSFPLEAQARQEKVSRSASAGPIQILSGGEHLLHGALPEYPRRAIEERVEGDVVLDVTVDDRGEVSDARVLSGPEALRRVALESVLQWHYSPESLRSSSTQVALRFNVPAAGAEARHDLAYATVIGEPGQQMAALVETYKLKRRELEKAMSDRATSEAQMAELKGALLEAEKRLERVREEEVKRKMREAAEKESQLPRDEGARRVGRIKIERVPREVVALILERAAIAVGDPFTETALQQIREAAKSVDEHVRVRVEFAEGDAVLVFIAP